MGLHGAHVAPGHTSVSHEDTKPKARLALLEGRAVFFKTDVSEDSEETAVETSRPKESDQDRSRLKVTGASVLPACCKQMTQKPPLGRAQVSA